MNFPLEANNYKTDHGYNKRYAMIPQEQNDVP